MGARSVWVRALPVALVLLLSATACADRRPGPGPTGPTPDPSAAASTTRAPTRTTPPPDDRPPAPPGTRPGPTHRPPRTFTVIAAGDILLHSELWVQAARDARERGRSGYDFGPMLASLVPAVSGADLAICHIESQLGPPTGPFTQFPIFSVPPQIADAVALTGYDSCSTASNHSIDGGEAGIRRTLDALDRVGVRHAGTARTPAEASRPTLLRVGDVTVAHLSYTYGFNGLRRPRGKEWVANLMDERAVLAEARTARRLGAEVVILSVHWGAEYSNRPSERQRDRARRLLASPDIDLMVGHHPHVVQPLERIGDEWVVYSTGNEVAYQDFSDHTRDGIMPRFTLTEVRPGRFRVTRAEVRPIHMWLDGRDKRVYDVAAELANPSTPDNIRAACRASRDRTAAVLGRLGAYRDGLTVAGWPAAGPRG
jgi:poly-gamma-glutamate capsule biosynthesis protein CapA/YwtB (metallophosphatase superfamily)